MTSSAVSPSARRSNPISLKQLTKSVGLLGLAMTGSVGRAVAAPFAGAAPTTGLSLTHALQKPMAGQPRVTVARTVPVMVGGAGTSPTQQDRAWEALPAGLKAFIDGEAQCHAHLYKVHVYAVDGHYVVYWLSSRAWGATKTHVYLDASGNVVSTFADAGRASIVGAGSPGIEISCPDNAVEFLTISAYPEVGSVEKAVERVSTAASARYKTVTVLGTMANTSAYMNWLSCTNLRGIYSIGHGDNTEIIVDDGIVDATFFAGNSTRNIYGNTTVVINSCLTYNEPFGTQMIFGNAHSMSEFVEDPGPLPHQYVSGAVSLLIGASERASACFFEKALGGERMSYEMLGACIGNDDLYPRAFGIAYTDRFFVA